MPVSRGNCGVGAVADAIVCGAWRWQYVPDQRQSYFADGLPGHV